MSLTELSADQWLNSIWLSLQRGEDTALLTMSRLEDLLSQNQQLLGALKDLQTAITHQPPPIIEIPQFPTAKPSKKEPDPNIATLAELFVKSQSANQVVLDQIKEVIKSQITADKQPTRIMAGGPKSVKLENDQGLVQDNWDDDGGLRVHVQNSSGGGAGVDPVSLKDGTNAAQKLAIDVNGRVGINNFPATQPVSLATNTPDVTDRAARLLGHVTVDSAPTTAVTGPLTDTQLRAAVVPTQDSRLPAALDADGGVKAHIQNFPATQPVSLATNTPDVTDRAARLLGHVTVDSAPTTPVTGTFWQTTQPVSVAAVVATKETRSATPAQSSVAASLTNVTLLASNANRLGATIYNDDTASVLSLKLGATASATSFTVKVVAGGYYEVPFGYTGIIDGLWNVATGSARITELT